MKKSLTRTFIFQCYRYLHLLEKKITFWIKACFTCWLGATEVFRIATPLVKDASYFADGLAYMNMQLP